MGQETPESSKNMALMPKGAEIIINTETGAPGFHIENIYVMAGIPWVMQAMFQEVKKILENLPGIGLPFITKSIDVFIGESIIARSLEELQQRYPQVTIGSYPYIESNRWGTTLSIRSKDEKSIDSALKELEKILEGLTE